MFEDILNDPKTNPEIFNMYSEEKKGEFDSPTNAEGGKTGNFDANLISSSNFVKLREVRSLF